MPSKAMRFRGKPAPAIASGIQFSSLKMAPAAPLGDHVLAIVFWRAEKKMLRPNAAAIVAFMKHPKAIWNRAEMLFP